MIPGALREAVARDGETIVYVPRERLLEVMTWLKQTPEQEFDYLVDVTAVEYRDRERPLEVVYFLRSLKRRADLRIKVELDPSEELWVDSVWELWHGADWLEREVFDMFGVTFRGHPDLRRILMWETYAEGYPLRKSFPLRGRFSRAEQVRQALNANPEAHYSLEELSIADAESSALRIWPTTGNVVEWPPSIYVDDASLPIYADRLLFMGNVKPL